MQHPNNRQRFSAVIETTAGGYIARCPELGTVGGGETEEDAIERLIEVTETYLRSQPGRRRYGLTKRVVLFDLPEPALC